MAFERIKDVAIGEYRFCERYKHVEHLVSQVNRLLGIDDMVNNQLNLTRMLVNKVGGYNCSLDGILRHIEMDDLHKLLYQIPIIRNYIAKRYYKSKEIYELDTIKLFDAELNSCEYQNGKAVYLATLENYLPIILSHAKSTYDRDEVIVILPDTKVAQTWHLFSELIRYGCSVLYLSSIHIDKIAVERIQSAIEFRWNEVETEISEVCVYDGFNYSGFFLEILRNFYVNFCPIHIVMCKSMANLLGSKVTHGYVARNRRALDNLFVQLCSSIGAKTVMLLHGMLTSDYDSWQLFTSNYEDIDEVIVFGPQQKYAIERKQFNIKKTVPNITICPSYFKNTLGISKTNSVQLTKQNPPAKKVLLVGQKFNDDALACLMHKIRKKNINAILRPYPPTKDRYIKKLQAHLMDNRPNLSECLDNYQLVVAHSSTVLLESALLGIAFLVLNFKQFNLVFTCTFWDEWVSEQQGLSSMFCIDQNDALKKVDQFFSDMKFRQMILYANRKLLTYFIAIDQV